MLLTLHIIKIESGDYRAHGMANVPSEAAQQGILAYGGGKIPPLNIAVAANLGAPVSRIHASALPTTAGVSALAVSMGGVRPALRGARKFITAKYTFNATTGVVHLLAHPHDVASQKYKKTDSSPTSFLKSATQPRRLHRDRPLKVRSATYF